MRPGQQNKRGRGRGNNNGGGGGGNNNNNNFNRKGGNPLTRTYDSSGPDVKIRGTAQHIAEKYAQLARDAQSSGDRVIAENYLQHAEHYNRIIAAAQAQMQERFQRDDRNDFSEGTEREGDDIEGVDNDDVVIVQPPRQQHEHQQRRSDEQSQRRHDEQPRRHDDQARQPRRQEQQPAAAPVEAVAAAPQPELNDGSGPQPEIEGIPAEVSMDEESAAGQPRERQPRRRATGSRPRRPRRAAEGEASAEGEDAGSNDAPALADAASE
ncbi:DUF4167 domain-containing protein [Rhizobium grahamii]|uniref:DUF4167 domain-containing protein n=1 Tax=Rhizobium grahamii TaxID=1120045 RepID=A0A370KLL5_9HYPH|nr:DUF4167 domain-containing protein [Rhizobium grahamii]RDJ09424.1 hypothetical protein B5K06_16650 [Rhizobium grahamii]